MRRHGRATPGLVKNLAGGVKLVISMFDYSPNYSDEDSAPNQIINVETSVEEVFRFKEEGARFNYTLPACKHKTSPMPLTLNSWHRIVSILWQKEVPQLKAEPPRIKGYKHQYQLFKQQFEGKTGFYGKSESVVFFFELQGHPSVLLADNNDQVRALGEFFLGKPRKEDPLGILARKLRIDTRRLGSKYNSKTDFNRFSRFLQLAEQIKKDPASAEMSKYPYLREFIKLMKQNDLL